jgi:hypothetical protein
MRTIKQLVELFSLLVYDLAFHNPAGMQYVMQFAPHGLPWAPCSPRICRFSFVVP